MHHVVCRKESAAAPHALVKCEREVTRHLEMCGLSEDQSMDNEMKLPLARAGN